MNLGTVKMRELFVEKNRRDVYKRQGEYDKEQKRYQSFALPCASFFLVFSGKRKRSGNLQRTGAEMCIRDRF